MMQQELDEFAGYFDGPLSQEEQELIKQLKQNEITTKSGVLQEESALASQIAEQDGGNDKMNAQEGERPNDLCALQEEEEEEIDEFADYKSNDMALKSRYRA